MTVAEFIAMFPEFSATPPATISAWLSVAVSQVNSTRWGNTTSLGIGLLAAHYIAVATKDQNAVTPGTVDAPISAKSAGGVSVSKEMGAVIYEKAGDFNMTSYGIRYYRLARMMGAGAIQAVGQGFSFPTAFIS